MLIEKLSQANSFNGKLNLRNINKNNLQSYDIIKDLVKDSEFNLFIAKHAKTSHLPNEDMYTVIASQNVPITRNNGLTPINDIVHGTSCVIINSKAKAEELSIRIYNAVENAIKILNKKVTER